MIAKFWNLKICTLRNSEVTKTDRSCILQSISFARFSHSDRLRARDWIEDGLSYWKGNFRTGSEFLSFKFFAQFPPSPGQACTLYLGSFPT